MVFPSGNSRTAESEMPVFNGRGSLADWLSVGNSEREELSSRAESPDLEFSASGFVACG